MTLDQLGAEQLKQIMFDRLHGHQSMGPPIEPHGDVSPHIWLVDQYGLKSSYALQSRMQHQVDQFVAELPDTQKWPVDARANLLDFVQDCPIYSGAVEDLIGSCALVKAGDPEGHASLLKCALSLGNNRSPSSWLKQLSLLGLDYGALVFGGLLQHGLKTAAKHLPLCCDSEEAIAHMLTLLPALVAQEGLEAVADALTPELGRLTPAARNALQEALKSEGYETPGSGDWPYEDYAAALNVSFVDLVNAKAGRWGAQ
jgi:hypothetical protein